MKLSIYSPERTLIDEYQVSVVTLPTSEGEIQVLPEHTNFLGCLEPGVFNYTCSSSGDQKWGFVSTGFFEVVNGDLSVMGETMELKEEIDIQRAKEAQKRAEDELKKADLSQDSFRKHQLKLERALIRQQLGR